MKISKNYLKFLNQTKEANYGKDRKQTVNSIGAVFFRKARQRLKEK